MDREPSKSDDKIKEYDFEHKLGEGGFATVWRAKSRRNGQTVAVKKICKRKMQACRAENRVKDEVAIHSRLKHKNVLEVLDVFEDKNYVYLVLELCENGTIANYLKTNKCSESEARRIFSEIVDGVIYLHSHKILHRDLTLGNILLTRNNEVKIADFGLATMLKRPDEKHLTMCGTPNFISPEIATRSSHGLEADVWSLGCMLFALLVGHPPFDTDTARSTLTRVVMGEYKVPSHLSAEAKDLIGELLKKNPRDRLKLHEIPKHPFLSQQNFLDKWRFSRESDDSGMCTMTTEGTHSLHHGKIIDTNVGQKRSAIATVGSILNECSVEYESNHPRQRSDSKKPHSYHNDLEYGPSCRSFDHQNTESYSTPGDEYVCQKLEAVDSGEDSEIDEHQALNYTRKQQAQPIRLRSRSEDRVHSLRPLGSNYLRSKLSGCEPGEYSSLPSKHPYHHPHSQTVEKLFPAPGRHKSCRHSRNNGVSTCSADCSADINWKPPSTAHIHSPGHGPSSHYDDLKHSVHSKCTSLKSKLEAVSLDAGAEPPSSPHCQNPHVSKFYASDGCCNSQCSGSSHEYLGKTVGRSASCSHLSQKRSHFSSEEMAEKKEFSSRFDVGVDLKAAVASPTLDRRKSLDHQISPSSMSSCSLQEVYRMLFSQKRELKEQPLNGPSDLRVLPPPLSTLRLLPTRHRTKNAILSILESGEVVIEFLKKRRPSYEECVVDVCRISGDGLRIVLYQLNGGKGCTVKDKPPDLPQQGTDAIYSYESLPEKHWKKYKYAVRFVNLVRAKTPKVTLYSDKAKSHLMENFPDPDFESCFYQGGKVSRTCEGLRLIDIEGQNCFISCQDQVKTLPSHAQLLWDHFVQCLQHCLMLEMCLSRIAESRSVSCKTRCVFPVIVGRRPVVGTAVLREKENIANGSIELSPAPLLSPNTLMLKSFEISSVTTAPQLSKLSHNPVLNVQNTPLTSRTARHSSKIKRSASSLSSHGCVRRVNISGVGAATQLPSGEVRIEYKDGSQLTVHPPNNGISFHSSDASCVMHCGPNDSVPDWLRDRLTQVPKIIQRLMESSPHADENIQQNTFAPKTRSFR